MGEEEKKRKPPKKGQGRTGNVCGTMDSSSDLSQLRRRFILMMIALCRRVGWQAYTLI